MTPGEPDRLVKMREACRMLASSRQTLYRWIKEGRLPPPIRLASNAVAWKASELWAAIDALPRGVDPAQCPNAKAKAGQ